jgi:Protein of unknown function (DUF3105)
LRIAVVVIVVVAGLAGLLLAFSARDDAEITAAPAGPGELQPDRGAEHVEGTDAPVPAQPPTSGPHAETLVTRDRRELSVDELLHALELGNVVLLYPGRTPPAALEQVQEDVAGPFDAELAAAGQAVILARHDGPMAALAWRRILESDDPAALRGFAESWLGVGLQP